MSDSGKKPDVRRINKNTDIQEFAIFCREYDRYMDNPRTEAEKLIYRMTHGKKTNEEYLKLENDIEEFVRTASEEDRRLVGGYTESLSMVCCAIREGRL